MSEATYPFEILGVPHDAAVDEIRAAYHRAALRCHPDTSPAHPEEAAQEFSRITEAYRACLRTCRFRAPLDDAKAKRMSPAEYAAREAERIAAVADYIREMGAARAHARGRREITRATLDETRVFIYLWPLGVMLALGVSVLVAGGVGDGPSGERSLAVFMGVFVLVYVASLAAIVVGLVLSREVVALAMQIIGYCARRALPGSAPKLPRRPRWWLPPWRRP